MRSQKIQKDNNSTFSNSSASQTPSQFAARPFGIQAQSASTQQQQEDATFAEQKMEATRLEIQAKHGTITPQEQERLTLLQAQMHELLRKRCENAAKYGHNIERIAFTRPDSAPPVQAKLTIGQPGDKYEQEADETAPQVVQRIHQQSNQQVLGADAYASGNQIAFKEEPSVELAAHEAAHVVQQASGKVQLSGGVGKVVDKYEQHADIVAERVEAGQSAKDLLAEYTKSDPGSEKSAEVVQSKCSKCSEQEFIQANLTRKEGLSVSLAMEATCRETARYPGNEEHKVIQQDYKQNINSNSAIEFSIPGSGPRKGTGYADIVDLRNYAIYEIKTFLGSPEGVKEANRYRRFAQHNCDPNVSWQIGTQYPKRVIPFDAQSELVAQQYPDYPGVITYYKRKKKRDQLQTLPENENDQKTNDDRKILQEIVTFVQEVVQNGKDIEVEVRRFLAEHPEVKNYLIGAAVGIAIATIAEDIVTFGGGVVDDPASLAVIWTLLRVALMAP